MADIDVSSLEPNTHKYKAEKAANKEREKVKPIIDRDKIVSTKKPLGKKFAEIFITDDVADIKTWLIKDVIIPGIQDTVLDMLSMMFRGESYSRGRSRTDRRDRYDDRTSYTSYYRSSNDGRDRNSRRRRDDRYESDDRVDFRNIVLSERAEAERLIDELRRRITDEGSVSIAELLELMGAQSRYTDANWGWDDERDIKIRRISSGFLIEVCEPRYLN